MKTLNILVIALLLSCSVWAQTPQRFNYQGAARNAAGEPMADSKIGLRLSITDGNVTLYSETFTPSTNRLGLFTVEVGGGNVQSGSFAAIDWRSGPKYLNVEMDADGGASYVNMGTSPLLSVPYALVAEKVSNMTMADLADVSDVTPQLGQTLQWNGVRWVPAAGSDDGGARAVVTDATLSGDGNVGTPLMIAQQGASTGQVLKWNGSTWLPANDGLSLPYSGSLGSASNGIQVTNSGTGAGILGKNTSSGNDTHGIRGEANSNPLSAGVHGRNVGPDNEGYGVFGSHEAGGIGVYGVSSWTGVLGQVTGTNCLGVHGYASGTTGTGVLGEGNTGVRGESGTANGKAIHGLALSGGYAGYFEGKVFLNGPLMPNNSAGVAGQVLTSAGTGAAPTWASPSNQMFNGTVLWDQSASLSLTTSDQNVTFNGVTDLTFTTYAATRLVINFSHGEVVNGSGGGGANSRVKFKIVLKDNAGSIINQANAYLVVPNNQLGTVSYTHHCYLGASGTYKINIVAVVESGDTDVSIAAAGGGVARGQVTLLAVPQ